MRRTANVYLKSLEAVGFKSFANRTKLLFEPGMTAIVGPNGCGKSNVSDAIRWVLGEQSAKAMRGTKMEDCIFNGTDNRKAMGMAEVSVTFADCEKALGTEYNEMTITRRVFRSGEGQYFLNKTACRLKDIQRLIMGTGIGTSSYSFMEQGRIDQILSSRPEDRRTIFEEASGITRFKADKKEALRKLEQTEANLLRLADVIREVKRQIGSLQRQAGKARRYKTLHEELRRTETYATRKRLAIMDGDIAEIEKQLEGLRDRLTALQREVEAEESANTALRERLVQTEREIGAVMEAGGQARMTLDHTHELIRVNEQRIAEYRQWAERDAGEMGETARQIDERRGIFGELQREATQFHAEHEQAGTQLQEATAFFDRHQHDIDAARAQIQKRRDESVEAETLISRLQNQVVDIDSRERSTVLQRERLAAEKAQLKRVASVYEKRQQEMQQVLEGMRKAVADAEEALLRQERGHAERALEQQTLQQRSADVKSAVAARRAQTDMLRESEEAGDGLPAGAKLLLDESNPLAIDRAALLGTLASVVEVDGEYRLALEAALRAWLDAVLMKDPASAAAAVRALEAKQSGAARILVADAPAPAPASVPRGARRLLDCVAFPKELTPLMQRLIGNVLVVDSLDAVPHPLPPAAAYVTRSGAVVRGDGSAEFWMPDTPFVNPFSRKHALLDASADLSDLEKELATLLVTSARLQAEQQEAGGAIAAARGELDGCRRSLAQKEGEFSVIASEARQAAERLETVSWEFDSLSSEGRNSETERVAVLAKIEELRAWRESMNRETAAQTEELRRMETRHTELQQGVTEHRIRFSSLSQRLEHVKSRQDTLQTNLRELEAALEGRSRGIRSYEASIEKLTGESAAAGSQLAALEKAVEESKVREAALRRGREQQAHELKTQEQSLARKRETMEDVREAKSRLDVRLAEGKMRRQNLADRVTGEYGITLEQLLQEPEPAWAGEAPVLETAETAVAELRTKIEAMGPVNLVAIEEYEELEERHAFLTTQEQDLINSKQQLMDMIRKINHTTTDMFSQTFEQVNNNFQTMFKKLFNGGSAKLVLVDEEDVLECGIEIIARPPGKKLQNVSLLSGGERTLTAVSLLFAIYMIKPSPFCFLDELDAALDDSNIGRFVATLKEFLEQSQFVVITHNHQTISAAEILYGVTMPEKGISKIVSMRFHARKSPGQAQEAAAAEKPVEEPEAKPAESEPAATEPAGSADAAEPPPGNE